jgi:hypothetical protein
MYFGIVFEIHCLISLAPLKGILPIPGAGTRRGHAGQAQGQPIQESKHKARNAGQAQGLREQGCGKGQAQGQREQGCRKGQAQDLPLRDDDLEGLG